MSSIFDVDCPRTPDGDSQEEHTPRHQRKKIPRMAPSRPPRMSRKSSRSSSRTPSSTRSRSTPRRVGGGLEPEEYIAPSFTGKSAAPSSGNAAIGRTRAFSSEMAGSAGLPRAPSSGPSRYVPPAPSSGPSAYTASPRAAPKSGGNDMQGSHPRTNSGDWWKEEIVDETENKDIAMDQHYGLSLQQQQQQQHQHFYGKTAANPFETENQHLGIPAARAFDEGDAEQQLHARANQMRHTGYYHSDDYSFNQMNLSDVPISPRDVGSPPRYREKKANVRNNLLPRWFSGFSPGRFQNDGMSPYMTNETNIAPKGSSTASSSEWISNSPNVFNPNGVRKRGIAGHWERLSPAKKVSVGVVLVALVCTIMGVAVSETKKNYAARENAALALAMANQPTPSPTSEPTSFPSLTPTDHPTRVRECWLHGKDSDGTPRPSRMPTTMTPTGSPESKLCSGRVQESPRQFKDVRLAYKEPGFSDRKNKNCGTQWPDGSVFPVTELGANCQTACSLYNSCGLMNARTQEFEYERPLPAISEMICEDQDGLFKNHIDNLKDCAWLDNDKAGHTDRKSKNCGWGPNLITELGWNCPQTCIFYNGSGCWDPADATSTAGMSIRASAAESTTSEEDDTACMNGSGTYENHKGEEEACDWLHTEFRLERNCGYERHDITPLGKKCPWSCREYNICSMPGAHR
ncbi:hypothetical protein QTG54_008147 [Skeletonema marinoi]|uniref:Uncharacterized protein n=2 Tax=Skeletonema marinoi TaxID=267567 RepID=A0AAD9DCQ1_9STRA|nr:hypothetical protein QTG54_008147 [Skeletonema marinoi]